MSNALKSPGRLSRPLGACLLAAVSILAGCLTAREIERTRHYALHPEITVETAAPLDMTLGIRPLFAARAYGLPMAVLDNDFQLVFGDRDQWAEPPASSVTRALSDALVQTTRFKDVGNAADMTRPDLLLTGELRIFQENRTLTPPAAELEVRLELRPAREPGVLWAETLRESVPLDAPVPSAFAAAMNLALARLAERAAMAIAAVEPPEELMGRDTPPLRRNTRVLQRQ